MQERKHMSAYICSMNQSQQDGSCALPPGDLRAAYW
jgi:hypothetical protein